jgi:hypothetical protein
MHMMKKRQLRGEAVAEGRTAAEQFYSLAASSLNRPGPLPLQDLLAKFATKRPCVPRGATDVTPDTAQHQRLCSPAPDQAAWRRQRADWCGPPLAGP